MDIDTTNALTDAFIIIGSLSSVEHEATPISNFCRLFGLLLWKDLYLLVQNIQRNVHKH